MWVDRGSQPEWSLVMPRLLLLDSANYDTSWPHSVRTAARAIIVCDGLVALIHSGNYGEYKFPGGGVEMGESLIGALHREVLEETGMHINPNTIVPYAAALELRQDRTKTRVFEQRSMYYRCDFIGEPEQARMTVFEKSRDYKLVNVQIETAIRANRAMMSKRNRPSFIVRDLRVMEQLARTLQESDTIE